MEDSSYLVKCRIEFKLNPNYNDRYYFVLFN